MEVILSKFAIEQAEEQFESPLDIPTERIIKVGRLMANGVTFRVWQKPVDYVCVRNTDWFGKDVVLIKTVFKRRK